MLVDNLEGGTMKFCLGVNFEGKTNGYSYNLLV